MDYILDHLAVGSFREALQQPGSIEAYLCVAEEKEMLETDCPYHKIPLTDMQPLPPRQLVAAVEWIHERIDNHRILVFCNAGVGRSPSVIIGYLYCQHGYDFGEAVEYVAERHPGMSTLPDLIDTIEDAKRLLRR
jgi:protein-tyrosine phosphatase